MKKLIKSIAFLAIFAAGAYTHFYLTSPSIKDGFITEAHAQATTTYYYPQVQNCGYRWNFLQRIYKDTGIWPISSGDVQRDGTMQTYVSFAQQLNQTQATAVDAIMLSPTPCDPPVATGTRYQVLDLYENKALIGSKWGNTNFWVWYSAGGTTAYLYFDSPLSQGDKNKVSSEFAKLLVEF